MPKCMYEGCTEKVVGGYEDILDAGDHENPHATLPGMKTAWCKTNEQKAKQSLGRGRFLSQEELLSE